MDKALDLATGIKPEPLRISRVFNAPREVVFSAWSSDAHMRRWFSPEHFTVPQAVVDFRPGGKFDICMRGPDGMDHWSRGHFDEIAAPERLVFSGAVVGENDAPLFKAVTTVIFEAVDGGTRMSVHQAYEIFDTNMLAAVAGAPEGWRTTLDKLAREVDRLEASRRG